MQRLFLDREFVQEGILFLIRKEFQQIWCKTKGTKLQFQWFSNSKQVWFSIKSLQDWIDEFIMTLKVTSVHKIEIVLSCNM